MTTTRPTTVGLLLSLNDPSKGIIVGNPCDSEHSRPRRHGHAARDRCAEDELAVTVERLEDKVHSVMHVAEGRALAELPGLPVVVRDLVAHPLADPLGFVTKLFEWSRGV
jgi:hypothetical protein